MPQVYGNRCKLLLPFGIGANGYARSSNSLLLGLSSNPPLHTDEADQLYQIIRYSGLLPGWRHGQFLVKILTSWAYRVELGDWVITENGVSGGMEKFKEADMPDHWEKYYTQIPGDNHIMLELKKGKLPVARYNTSLRQLTPDDNCWRATSFLSVRTFSWTIQ
jgi:hypothetical protein